jgi:hypothetical protein
MKAKFKKYNVGGLIQAGLGLGQTIYGATQLPKAKAEFERATAAAPSLETPSQYYENFKNAYDSELARMQDDMINRNLATSVQALQGAGGRALVGGLGAATAQAQASQNQMLAQERQMRMQAGQDLAAAQERTIGRKEARSQQQISMANQAYQAALGNIAGGLGSIGTGLMYGLEDFDLKGMIDGIKEKREFMNTPVEGAFTPKKAQVMDSSSPISGGVNMDASSFVQMTTNQAAMGLEKAETDFLIENEKRRRLEQSAAASNSGTAAKTDGIGPNYSLFSDRLENAQYMGAADQMDISQLPEVEGKSYSFVGGNVYQRDDSSLRSFEKGIANKIGDAVQNSYPNPFLRGLAGAYNAVDSWLDNASRIEQERQAALRRSGNFATGGMVTAGEFSHKKNPIDIVQNGVKVGEATGNEYILNPKQAAAIAKESSYAKKLFKRFEKNAKKKK